MADKVGIKEAKVIDVVSQDKDWRDVVRNELRCQENWQKDWGFLADSGIAENPKTKEERIQILEEKLKGMKDIELGSVSKMSYMGPSYDIRETQYNRKKQNALMPQTRRPKATSKAYKWLKEQGVINDDDK
jgi:hypothetical protein